MRSSSLRVSGHYCELRRSASRFFPMPSFNLLNSKWVHFCSRNHRDFFGHIFFTDIPFIIQVLQISHSRFIYCNRRRLKRSESYECIFTCILTGAGAPGLQKEKGIFQFRVPTGSKGGLVFLLSCYSWDWLLLLVELLCWLYSRWVTPNERTNEGTNGVELHCSSSSAPLLLLCILAISFVLAAVCTSKHDQ